MKNSIWFAVSVLVVSLLSVKQTTDIEDDWLMELNAIRSKKQQCGKKIFPSAPSLQIDSALIKAACVHAEDIAKNQFRSHKGSDGSYPQQRVAKFTIGAQKVGEAIAFTSETDTEAVKLLMKSKSHCEILMDTRYTHIGMAPIVGTYDLEVQGYVFVLATFSKELE
ncbi:MAG: CAP domain-containing protein [Schleiferiaceae bacterium]|nr:CAP domain-containing protein [Schleiferiaceae bacterium]